MSPQRTQTQIAHTKNCRNWMHRNATERASIHSNLPCPPSLADQVNEYGHISHNSRRLYTWIAHSSSSLHSTPQPVQQQQHQVSYDPHLPNFKVELTLKGLSPPLPLKCSTHNSFQWSSSASTKAISLTQRSSGICGNIGKCFEPCIVFNT